MVVNFICICKLLFLCCELDNLFGCINCEGMILIVLLFYWFCLWVKIKIGVVKGKKLYDKCEDLKEKEW